jgi:hypothetical protein
LAGGVNLYSYAGSNPVSFSDPYGLCPIPPSNCLDVVMAVVSVGRFVAAPSLATGVDAALDIAGALPGVPSTGVVRRIAANASDAVDAGRSARNALHGNNLNTARPAQGYSLRDRETGRVLKYGETTRGKKRYSQRYLEDNNADMVFESNGTKREMHHWQHERIVEHKAANNGERPPLNKSDY